jgi:peptidoglycan-N-acetylglucosamine deacetylase
MWRGLFTQGAAALVVAFCFWLARTLAPDSSAACIIASVAVALAIAVIAWIVTSPRSQFFVPTHFEGPPTRPAIALTFDDGPDPNVTPRVLEVLAQADARATFFMVGEAARKHPELVRQVMQAGHEIGSHTEHHSNFFHVLRARPMAAEITRGVRSLQEITGRSPRWFRPPQGLRVPTLRDALARCESLQVVTWSTRALDTTLGSSTAIHRRLAGGLRPGAIFTLHDGTAYGGRSGREAMLDALCTFLRDVRKHSYQTMTLSELLGGADV